VSGYNIQCDRVVLGIEGDTSWVGFETNSRIGTVRLTDEIDWFGTFRGRFGLMIGEGAMVYGTAGLAYADISHKIFDPGAPGGTFRQKDDGWEFGWTIGGGVELLRDSRWMVRAEALYVDLGEETHKYTIRGGGCVGVCTERVKWDDSFWVARVGLSYKFDLLEARPEPLK